jgi:hypothetical protein
MKTSLFNPISSKIVDCYRNEDKYNKRTRVVFSNGYELSIVNGWGMHCDAGTYEVAVIKDEKLDYTHTRGDVLGYQSPEEILSLATLISNL